MTSSQAVVYSTGTLCAHEVSQASEKVGMLDRFIAGALVKYSGAELGGCDCYVHRSAGFERRLRVTGTGTTLTSRGFNFGNCPEAMRAGSRSSPVTKS
jgi:hypothetical protein|tara:strand:- start:879 stop:1172 length:294 start_codon:yes stop_codon:yes gene_type:complete